MGSVKSIQRPPRDRLIAAAILAVTLVIGLLAFWPGRMNYDTFLELSQVKSGHFNDQHAPLIQAIWHPFFVNGFGPGWMLLMQLSAFLSGGYLVLRLLVPRVWAAALIAFVTLTPLVLGQLVLIGRDAWFLASLMVMFGSLAVLYRSEGRRRWAIAVIVVIGAWLALAARQNAAAAVVVGLIVLVALLRYRDAVSFAWKPALVSIAIGVVATIGLMVTQSGARSALNVKHVHPDLPLYVYDLTALSIRDNKLYVPPVVMRDHSLGNLQAAFSPDEVMVMIQPPGSPLHNLKEGKRQAEYEALRKEWRKRITADPIGWLRVRSRIYRHEVSLGTRTRTAFESGLNPGYRDGFSGANSVATSYLNAFQDDRLEGNFLYTVWVYLLGGLIATALLIRRRTWPTLIAGSVGLAALTYQAGLYFGLLGINYRFEFPAVSMSLIVIAGCAAMYFRERFSTSES